MPYSNGTFTPLYNWTNDANAGIKIRADRMDGQDQDIATGLTTCITKDGQTVPTDDLPMGGYKHTDVGPGDSRTNYAAISQVQDGALIWGATAGGTANAITINLTPIVTSYTAGLTVLFIAANSNTGAVTLNVNGISNITIKKNVSQDLVSGDIVIGQVVQCTFDGTNFQLLTGAGSGGGGSGPTPVSGVYVAVGENTTVSSSPDGVTFTQQPPILAGTYSLPACCQQSGYIGFPILNSDNRPIWYTTNGTTLTRISTQSASFTVSGFSVTASAGITQGAFTGNPTQILRFTGTTYSTVSVGSSIDMNGTLLAASDGTSSFLVCRVDNARFDYSTNNGSSFTGTSLVHTGSGSGTITTVGNANGYWLIGYSSGDIAYKSSLSGTTLTNVSSVVGANQVNKFIFTGTKWVAICNSGRIANASSIGTWTSRTSNATGNIVDIAYNNGLLIAVTSLGEIISSSNNGDTWALFDSTANPFNGSALKFIKFRKTKFWTGGSGGKLGQSNTDSTAFSLVTSGFGSTTINDFEAI